jgi:hypothetical protein
MFWVQTHWCAGESRAGIELDLQCQTLAIGFVIVFQKKNPGPLQYSPIKRKFTLLNLLKHCIAIACHCQTCKVNLSHPFLTPSL